LVVSYTATLRTVQDERNQARTERDDARHDRSALSEQVRRVRAIHVPHACPDPNCHQLGDCEQCGAPHPCATLTVALDGTEAHR
jgi:hypothetical protein